MTNHDRRGGGGLRTERVVGVEVRAGHAPAADGGVEAAAVAVLAARADGEAEDGRRVRAERVDRLHVQRRRPDDTHTQRTRHQRRKHARLRFSQANRVAASRGFGKRYFDIFVQYHLNTAHTTRAGVKYSIYVQLRKY